MDKYGSHINLCEEEKQPLENIKMEWKVWKNTAIGLTLNCKF